MVNTRANWLRFGAFLSPTSPSLHIHRPLSSRPTRHAPRRHQRGQAVADPPADSCMQPTAELVKTERDPISTSTPSISVCHRKQTIRADKINPFLPTRRRPTVDHSLWPEALNASGSRRACRMAISRNASSLLALPDFPEFAPTVRHGVPGTPPGTPPGTRLTHMHAMTWLAFV